MPVGRNPEREPPTQASARVEGSSDTAPAHSRLWFRPVSFIVSERYACSVPKACSVGQNQPSVVSLHTGNNAAGFFRAAILRNPMNDDALLARVVVDPKVCRGRPYIRGTRIYIAIILFTLTQRLTPEQVIDHYPSLVLDDIRAAVAYATKLAEENGGVAVINDQSHNNLF